MSLLRPGVGHRAPAHRTHRAPSTEPQRNKSIGLTFRPTAGGPDYYGWLLIVIHNTSPGKIISWAYNSVATTPEPGALALLGLAGAGVALRRRRG